MKKLALLLVFIIMQFMTYSQNISAELIKQWNEEYKQIENPELSYKDWMQIKSEIYQVQQKNGSRRITCPLLIDPNGCTNGDFNNNNALSAPSWQGEYGSVDGNGILIPTSIQCGILSGNINSNTSHHTIVPNGIDPNVPFLSTTPDGFGSSLRIGNAVSGNGLEFVTKTFAVTPSNSNFSFDYAVVVQNPASHSNTELPTFRVEIIDETFGGFITGLVDLDGSGNNFVISNNAAFFTNLGTNSIVYSNWLCCNINLSSLIGRTISIRFITEDCGLGAHFGYAYIDNVCNGCGNAPFALLTGSNSSDCNLPATICFDYQTPVGQSLVINLEAESNGTIFQTWSSPTLSGNGNYCFNITQVNGVPSNLDNLNFNGIGNFSNAPTQFAGFSNYSLICPGSSDDSADGDACITCCPGQNLIKNGSFENELQFPPDWLPKPGEKYYGFSSSYMYKENPIISSSGRAYPGEWSVMNTQEAVNVSEDWEVLDPDCCDNNEGVFKPSIFSECCNLFEKFLFVNGRNNQPAGSKAIIYSFQQPVYIPIDHNGNPIVSKPVIKDYKFCVDMKHLRQSTFDVIPEGSIVITDLFNNQTEVVNYSLTYHGKACKWDKIEKQFSGYGPFKVEISLIEDKSGDGNDLAIDNIAINEIEQTDDVHTQIKFSAVRLSGTSYGLIALPAKKIPADCSYFWEVCELKDDGYNCKPGTTVTNPSRWWGKPKGHTDFSGYNGTSTLAPGKAPGKFDIRKAYKIKFAVWCECSSWNEMEYFVRYNRQEDKVDILDVDGNLIKRLKLKKFPNSPKTKN